jgi:hypothetical protein
MKYIYSYTLMNFHQCCVINFKTLYNPIGLMLSRANAIFRYQKYCDYFNFYPIDYEALVFHPKNIATIMINFLNGRKIMTYEVTSDEPWFIFSCQVIFF